MKTCAKCKQEKQPCEFYASKRFKDGLRKECKQCDKTRALDWHKANPEKSAANNKDWCERNPDKCAEHRKKYYGNNTDARKQYSKEWREKNKERYYAVRKEYYYKNADESRRKSREYSQKNPEENRARATQWKNDNPDKVRVRNAAWRKAHPEISRNTTRLRRAQLKGAKVAWADKWIMREIYSLARLRTKVTGIAWSVDHIVPIKSKLVCGLHCEANLQVIEGLRNSRKSNTTWPDMP